MKKLSLLIVALLSISSINLFAQQIDSLETKTTDTTQVKIGNRIITVIEDSDENIDINIKSETSGTEIDVNNHENEKKGKKKKNSKFEGHWHGFEFGFNGLVDANNELPDKNDAIAVNMVRSWTFGLNLFQKDIPLIGNNFGLVTGLGMQWRNYHWNNDIELDFDNEGTYATPLNPLVDVQKNRLQATYLTVPVGLELQFPIGPNKSEFFVLAGAYGNFKIGSNYKTEWEVEGKKYEDKVKESYNLSRFDYGLTARVGIDGINLFANYSLSPLFEEGEGITATNYYPVTVGLMIVGF